MRYKTKRETYTILAVILLLNALNVVGLTLTAGTNVKNMISIVGALVGTVLAIIFLIYSGTANVKRNKFAKYGERFRGTIVAY